MFSDPTNLPHSLLLPISPSKHSPHIIDYDISWFPLSPKMDDLSTKFFAKTVIWQLKNFTIAAIAGLVSRSLRSL